MGRINRRLDTLERRVRNLERKPSGGQRAAAGVAAAIAETRSDVDAVTADVVPVQRDDLTAVTWIGPKIQGHLYERGIFTYAQVAALSFEEYDNVYQSANQSRYERMVASARKLAGS